MFQITFKARVPTRSFEGSVAVSLPTPSQIRHLFLSGQVANLFGFLNQHPSLIWNTAGLGCTVTHNN